MKKKIKRKAKASTKALSKSTKGAPPKAVKKTRGATAPDLVSGRFFIDKNDAVFGVSYMPEYTIFDTKEDAELEMEVSVDSDLKIYPLKKVAANRYRFTDKGELETKLVPKADAVTIKEAFRDVKKMHDGHMHEYKLVMAGLKGDLKEATKDLATTRKTYDKLLKKMARYVR